MGKTVVLVTFLIVGFLAFFIGAIYLCAGNKFANAMYRNYGVRLVFCGVLFMLCAPASSYVIDSVQSISSKYEAQIAEIQENSDTLTFYLDGEEVDYESIDLFQYKISYKPEEKKVFMTRRSSGTGFLPIPIFYGR